MKIEKSIGLLLILGSIGVLVPYTVVTITFNYPDILRLDSAQILRQFHQEGPSLIFTWLALALSGILIKRLPSLSKRFTNLAACY